MNWYTFSQSIRTGYRGVNINATHTSFSSGTEGMGLYVAWTEPLARWFSNDVVVVKYHEPRNPFVIQNEPLYLLEESDEIYQPSNPSDRPFLKACKQAVLEAGVTLKGWTQYDNAKIIMALTGIFKKNGHDAVRVYAHDGWDVILDKSLIVSMTNTENKPTTGTNWYGRQKIASLTKLAGVTFSIEGTHNIAQPADLSRLCSQLLNFIYYQAKMVGPDFAPYMTDIEPDGNDFDKFTGTMNFYIRPNSQSQNTNMSKYIEAIKAWIADRAILGFVITLNEKPETSRMYGVPVFRIYVQKNPSESYEQLPQFGFSQGNAMAVFRMLGIPEDYSGVISAADLKQRINQIQQESMQREVVEPSVEQGEEGKGPTIYDGGRNMNYLDGALQRLYELADYALRKGFDQIGWG